MAANPVKGETPLVLGDGRAFTLVLDHEALLGIEQTYGKPLPRVMADASEGFLSAVTAIAQAAFARHHPEVTRGEIAEMVMGKDEEALSAALSAAVETAFPSKKPAGNAPAPKAEQPLRGKTSGRSGAKRS